ncbi:MAG: hypothetical protein IANPNBLG_02071 [Bryobacteraceae bacterium]|nr:hypothetical protein [Bryobacteraceae bacterium]
MATAGRALIRVVARMEKVVNDEPVRCGLHDGVMHVRLRGALIKIVPVVVPKQIIVVVEAHRYVGFRRPPGLLRHHRRVVFHQGAVRLVGFILRPEVHLLGLLARRRICVDGDLHLSGDALGIIGESVGSRRFGSRVKERVRHNVIPRHLGEDARERPPARVNVPARVRTLEFERL